MLDEIVGGLLRDDPGVALQYAPGEGIPSVREYLIDRQEQPQGRRPAQDELMVTSGGMECIRLACHALLDPGDTVAVEAPTYLGALMAFAGFEARVEGIAMDEHGLQVDALEERLEAGLRPKLLYVIPEFQNPTGRTLSLERRHALVELCRRHDVLIFEDVAYREMSFDGGALPSLWSLAPDVVVQAGHVLEDLRPGVRLGWAAGPRRRDRGAGRRQAVRRPVRGRARAADGRGVRPRRALRAPDPALARALRGGWRATEGALRRTCRRRAAGASRPAASSPG